MNYLEKSHAENIIKVMDKLDELTMCMNFDLAILSSAVKDADNLKVWILDDFIQKIYNNSKKIRNIFDNEILDYFK